MKILSRLVLFTAILVLMGCSDDQSGQPEQPATTAAQDMTSMQDEAAMQEHIAEQAHTTMQSTPPAWAKLENNVYHYPQ